MEPVAVLVFLPVIAALLVLFSRSRVLQYLLVTLTAVANAAPVEWKNS